MPHADPEVRAEYRRQYYLANKEKLLERQKEYQKETADKRAAVNKARYERKKPEIQEKQKLYRAEHRDKLNAYAKEYTKQNREMLRAKAKARHEATKTTHAKQNLVSSAVWRGKQNGLHSDLVASDLVWPDLCPVFGVKLTYNGQRGNRDTRASLDRRDPAIGYTKENVRVISMRANRIKSDATIEELQKIIAYVEHFK
jgi:hypothetical protein